MKAIPIVVIVVVLIAALVFAVRFTVTDYFEKNNVAFLNEKLIEEFKNKKIKAIEYIAAIDENGNRINIFLDSGKEDFQHGKESDKQEEIFSLETLNVLNRHLFALSGLACTPLETGEPSPCLASKRTSIKRPDGSWTSEHCHYTMPEGAK